VVKAGGGSIPAFGDRDETLTGMRCTELPGNNRSHTRERRQRPRSDLERKIDGVLMKFREVVSRGGANEENSKSDAPFFPGRRSAKVI
jgi:hypothetical protein